MPLVRVGISSTVLMVLISTDRVSSHSRFMDYDEACIMHLTPGVVHNFPKAVNV